jgi:hypothetical protein
MTLRDKVLERDHWRCQVCGVDCLALEAAYHTARIIAMNAHQDRIGEWTGITAACVASGLRLNGELLAINSRLRALGFAADRSFAEVDHVVPLAEGGDNSLANLRTLCWRCHSVVTAELAGRRGRRMVKAWHPPRVDRQGRRVFATTGGSHGAQ